MFLKANALACGLVAVRCWEMATAMNTSSEDNTQKLWKSLDSQLFIQHDLCWCCLDYTNYPLAQRIWKGIQTFAYYQNRPFLYFYLYLFYRNMQTLKNMAK